MSGAAEVALNKYDEEKLLQLARQSIVQLLTPDAVEAPEAKTSSLALQQQAASFVTLTLEGHLRGCIGSLQAHRSLLHDVIDNAQAAAFEDPRFPPVSREELERLQIEISVLSPLAPMHFSDEEDLLRQIRPGIDGLLLEQGHHRATFLPLVWRSLRDKKQFLQQLKLKAGLAEGYWSQTLKVFRYRTSVFEESSTH